MNDSLGDRHKGYEAVTRFFLPARTNMILRVDGRAFHGYTRSCKRPYDDDLMAAMDQTAIALCEEVQGAKLAYVQSDEITVWSTSYDNLGSMPWFGGNVQKIVSVAASVATARFNQARFMQGMRAAEALGNDFNEWQRDDWERTLSTAHFDARVFTIPELAEVANCFKWRGDDCSRNSIQMMARSLYSHKDLDGKSTEDLIDLIRAKGREWEDLAPRYKRGRLVKRVEGKWTVCDVTDFTWAYWMGIVKAEVTSTV